MLTEIDNLNSGIAARLAELLVLHDMKQSELAQKLQVDQSVVSSWLNGRRTVPPEKRINICDLFDVPIAELSSFNCEIPIYGEVQDDFSIIDFDPIKHKKRLLIKNLYFPADCIGYIYGINQKYSWRYNAIWVVRVVKGRWADTNKVHPQSDGRLCLIQPTGGRKILGVPFADTDGTWNIHAMNDGNLIHKDVEVDYAIPILSALPNWSVLEKSFDPNLES